MTGDEEPDRTDDLAADEAPPHSGSGDGAAATRDLSEDSRAFLVAAVTMSLIAWDISYNFAVFGDVDYATYQSLWVTCMAVIFGSWFLDRDQRPLGFWGTFVLVLPTLYWPGTYFGTVIAAADPSDESLWTSLAVVFSFLFLLGTALGYLLAVPFALFSLAKILDPRLVVVPLRRMQFALAGITVLFLVLGAVLGSLHPYYMTCDTFELAGSMLPDNCTPALFE